MERLVLASFNARDSKRAERLAALNAVLLPGAKHEAEVLRVLELTLGWLERPQEGADVALALALFASCLRSPALRPNRLREVLATYMKAVRANPSRLWAVAELLRLGVNGRGGEALAAAVAAECMGNDAMSWVPVEWRAAKFAVCSLLGTDRTLVAPVLLQTEVLGWFETQALATPPADFERACDAALVTLGRVWETDGHLMVSALGLMLERLRKCVEAPVSFALALSLVPSAAMQVLPLQLVEEALGLSGADLVHVVLSLAQFPMRPYVSGLLLSVLEDLRRRHANEALARITFQGALASLVLQLYVPSCRFGALAVMEQLLLGWQSNPEAFHAVFPALCHVVQFLVAERAHYAMRRVSTAPATAPHALDISALKASHTILLAESAPVFSAAAPDHDYELAVGAVDLIVDVLPELARVVLDQTQIHTGFYSSLHIPLLRALKPYLIPGYRSNVPALRRMAWSRDVLQGNRAASVQSGASSNAPAAYREDESHIGPRLPGIGVGLVNLGNTCYINSLLQGLFHAESFVAALSTAAAKPMHQVGVAPCFVCSVL
jgi:hypothetical protein